MFEDTASSRAVLDRVKDVVEEGYAGKHLQRLPHITLLNRDFYTARLRPVMAQWACLWLVKHHLHGISGAEAVEYMLEGGAARSEAGKKLRSIEGAIKRRRVELGLDPAAVPLTVAHQGAMTRQESEERSSAEQGLMRQMSEEAASESSFNKARRNEELTQLEEAAAVAQHQIESVEKVYEYEQHAANIAQQRAERLARLELKMKKLGKVIKLLEFPRDSSLDNM